MSRIKTIITCEHSSKRVPKSCNALLTSYISSAEPHQVYDWGAKQIARNIAKRLDAPIEEGDATRLVIDLNRSLQNQRIFSPPIRNASEVFKANLVSKRYLPFRKKVEKQIHDWITEGFIVIHFSIHSFTPVFKGKKREVDIGVLYDPSRSIEQRVAESVIETFRRRHEDLTILANEPYKGKADGHTTALRKQFPFNYAGIELEYSQGLDLVEAADEWSKDTVVAFEGIVSQSAKTFELCL